MVSHPLSRASLIRGLAFSLALILLIAACSEKQAPLPPPLPADMSTFDTEIVAEIRLAAAEVERAPNDAEKWLGLGLVYHAHDQFDLARECYRQGLSLQPPARLLSARTHYFLALAEQRSGSLEAAIRSARRAIELDPSYLPSSWRLGLMLLEDGNSAEAIEVLEEVLPRASDEAAAHHALARAYLQAGEPARAASLLETWLKRHANDRHARFLLGTSFRRLGRPLDAERELALGAGARPEWSDPWSDEILSRRAGFSSRLAAATDLLEADPQQAVMRLEKLQLDRPDNATVAINLGIGYRRTGRLEDSVSTLREALRIEPGRGLIHFHLAVSLSELARRSESRETGGDLTAQALEHATRAVQLQPTSSRSHAMLGEVLARAGQTEEAAASYSRAVIDPQDPAWLHRLGGLLCQLGRWAEAVQPLEQYLIRTGGGDTDALLQLGVAQANSGQTEAARRSLQRALAGRPDDDRIHRALAQLDGSRRGGAGPRESGGRH